MTYIFITTVYDASKAADLNSFIGIRLLELLLLRLQLLRDGLDLVHDAQLRCRVIAPLLGLDVIVLRLDLLPEVFNLLF